MNCDISESGVGALRLKKIDTKEEIEDLSQTKLGCIQMNRIPQFKRLISAYDPGARPEIILVLTGSKISLETRKRVLDQGENGGPKV